MAQVAASLATTAHTDSKSLWKAQSQVSQIPGGSKQAFHSTCYPSTTKSGAGSRPYRCEIHTEYVHQPEECWAGEYDLVEFRRTRRKREASNTK